MSIICSETSWNDIGVRQSLHHNHVKKSSETSWNDIGVRPSLILSFATTCSEPSWIDIGIRCKAGMVNTLQAFWNKS